MTTESQTSLRRSKPEVDAELSTDSIKQSIESPQSLRDSWVDQNLPLDVVFELLKNERRRRVLRYLNEGSESTTLRTLAEHIAGLEYDKPPDALSSDERKRVYIGLYQCHLPKLDDAGVIDFESNRGTVERTTRADQLLGYIDRLTDRDEEETPPSRNWASWYLGIATFFGGLYLLQAALVQSFNASAAIVVLLLGSVLTTSFIQAQEEQ